MAFMFSDSFDELESTRLSLKVLTKEQGNEREKSWRFPEITLDGMRGFPNTGFMS